MRWYFFVDNVHAIDLATGFVQNQIKAACVHIVVKLNDITAYDRTCRVGGAYSVSQNKHTPTMTNVCWHQSVTLMLQNNGNL